MAPRPVYPKSNLECVRLLLTLGFVKDNGIGRGKHPEKYHHPYRKNIAAPPDRPFVLLTHDYFDQLGKNLMKKLQNWGFTKDEIEAAYRGVNPTSSVSDVKIKTDLEEV